MTVKIQQDTPPCCICYTQKKNKSIVEYKCTRCLEGIVCEQCAIQLWTANSGGSCPVCNNKTIGRETWYKSYDIEMGEINPPNINESNNQDNNENNVEEDEIINCSLRDNMCLVSFLILLSLFMAFIMGTVYKSLEKNCSWNCPNETTELTILTSIGIGIVLIPVAGFIIAISVILLSSVYGLLGMLLSQIIYFCKKIRTFVTDEIIRNENIWFIIEERSKNYFKYFIQFIILIGASWAVGIMFKISQDICYWNCKNSTNLLSFLTAVMVGFPILIISILIIAVVSILIALILMCITNYFKNR